MASEPSETEVASAAERAAKRRSIAATYSIEAAPPVTPVELECIEVPAKARP
jgi:hypothetical protein